MKPNDTDGRRAIDLAWQAMGKGDTDAVKLAAARLQGLTDLHDMTPNMVAAVKQCAATCWTWVRGA